MLQTYGRAVPPSSCFYFIHSRLYSCMYTYIRIVWKTLVRNSILPVHANFLEISSLSVYSLPVCYISYYFFWLRHWQSSVVHTHTRRKYEHTNMHTLRIGLNLKEFSRVDNLYRIEKCNFCIEKQYEN